MTTKEMVKVLNKAKSDYYTQGTSELSDAEFDALENQLRAADPNNKYFYKVGHSRVKDKITHAVPMLSLDKDNTVEGVWSWLDKIGSNSETLVCMPKIDGLSGSVVYVDGKLSYIATRGNGKVGQDVTHLAKFLNIPAAINLSGRFEVRGELYLRKDTSIPNPEGKSWRNIAAGLVNPLRKDQDPEVMNELKFVSYWSSSDAQYLSSHITQLEDLGFDIVEYKVVKKEDIESCYLDYLHHQREEMHYETDGLVFAINDTCLYDSLDSKYVVGHHHLYNFALKPPSDEKETILITIEWSVSKSGSVIPVGILEPINIGGATVSKVTLNNFENVQKLNLHREDRVLVARSNDVIPLFKKRVQASNNVTPVIPRLCPSCGSKLEVRGVHLMCDNSMCMEKNIQLIASWVKDCEMHGVSEETIRKLYDEKIIASIADLYRLDRNRVIALDGFGDSKTNNLMSAVEKSRTMTIVQFLARLSITGVGEKAVTKLGIKTVKDFENFKGDNSVVGQNVLAYKNDNINELKELQQLLHITDAMPAAEGLKQACMTGTGPRKRKELEQELLTMSYTSVDDVRSDIDVLICDNLAGTSSKLKKATKLGIKIVTYDEFFKSI